ncbi:hypothetical protein GCM10020221_32240 [Streptomyces thioluteus]|uniref:Carrier domain-containing protein n=1 Tax=Streptomyces thioluteus TaxID=66431 RepID=A0ABP6JI12_STRTU
MPSATGTDGPRPLLPFSWSGVTLEASRATAVRVRLAAAGDGAVSLAAVDAAGRPVITVESLALRPLSATAVTRQDTGLHLRWQPSAADAADGTPPEVAVAHVEPGGDVHARLADVLAVVQGFLAEPADAGTRLAVVTRGTLVEHPDPVTAAVWGLLRSAQAEHPGRLLLVDVDVRSPEALAAAVASGEPQVAVRDGQVLVPRLTRTGPAVLALPEAPAWRLESDGGGDAALVADPAPGGPLRPAEIRVSMRAAGATGTEGAGVVTEAGTAVTGVAAGDRVLGTFPHGDALGSAAVTDHRSVVRVPRGWTFGEAAASAGAFRAAWHALVDGAGLRAGERVLVLAGAGDAGLAGVRIARQLGAEVFAAAPPAAWDALREAGAHPVDEDEVPAGTDVVLDPRADGADAAAPAGLADGARFVTTAGAYEPADAGPVPAGLADLLDRDALRPLPVRSVDIRTAAGALRPAGATVFTLPRPLDPDGTVIVTGASGTLGQLVLHRLVSAHGVRRVLLLSRSGAGAPAGLPTDGVHVDAVACDVADREQLARALARIPAEHPPTAVVHTAGVLDDGVLDALTPERLGTVLRPKADAVRNLHELTADADLAAFVVFSSAAGVLGSAGQANYAAANAFLDAFVARRHAAGLPAVSVAWGLWAESSAMTAGLGAADRNRIARLGFLPTSTEEGLAAFGRALSSPVPLVVPVRLDPAALRSDTAPVLLRDLAPRPDRRTAAAAEAVREQSLEAQLGSLPAERRAEVLLDLVLTDVALVLGHGDARDVSPDEAFRDLGFDSLTAVELRNRLGGRIGLKLAATAVFDYPSPRALAGHLLDRLAPASPAAPTGPGRPTYEQVLADLGRLGDSLAALELTGAQRAELAETLRGLAGPPSSGGPAEETADLESATASEVLDFVTNSLGISIDGDSSPTDPS